MSRPGNTSHITDSTKKADAQGVDTTEVRSDRGQPRPSGLDTARMPSAAERTRTLVQSTCSAVLLVTGVEGARTDQLMPRSRTLGRDGELYLLFPADSAVVGAATHAQDDELAAVLEITDVPPVAMPNRIRGRARVSGSLTSAPGRAAAGLMMLRLDIGGIQVDDLWGPAGVDPEDLAGACADPLAWHEAELLQHLHAAHSEQLRDLRALLGARAPDVESAVPVALDRFGLRVRFTGARSFDVRFDFAEPVRDVTGLRRAMHTLFDTVQEGP